MTIPLKDDDGNVIGTVKSVKADVIGSAMGRLEAALSGMDTNRTSRGPRNLPEPDARKQRRQNAKAARKRNR